MALGDRYCIDSDILIDYLRGISRAKVFLAKAPRPLHISIVAVIEIFSGREMDDRIKREAVGGEEIG